MIHGPLLDIFMFSHNIFLFYLIKQIMHACNRIFWLTWRNKIEDHGNQIEKARSPHSSHTHHPASLIDEQSDSARKRNRWTGTKLPSHYRIDMKILLSITAENLMIKKKRTDYDIATRTWMKNRLFSTESETGYICLILVANVFIKIVMLSQTWKHDCRTNSPASSKK